MFSFRCLTEQIFHGTEENQLKKRLIFIMLGSMIVMLLCSCTGGPVNIEPSGNTNTAPASSAAPQSEAAQTESSAAQSSAPESAADDSSENETDDESSSLQSSEVSAEESAQESSEAEESSAAASSQKPVEESKTESSAAEKTDTPAESSEQQEITPREYIDPLKMTVDISDKDVAAAKTDLSQPQVYYITNTTELHNFYEKYKSAYSLDKTDSGVTFNEDISTLDNTFFKDNDAVIIVQQYNKNKEITIGDVYKQGSGTAVDIYKEAPSSADDTAYVLDIIGALKTDFSGKAPSLNILPAGGYITDEPDDDDQAEIIEE